MQAKPPTRHTLWTSKVHHVLGLITVSALGACGVAEPLSDEYDTAKNALDNVSTVTGTVVRSNEQALPRTGQRRTGQSQRLASALQEAAPPPSLVNEVTKTTLLQLNRDILLPHEGYPRGVPSSYDWVRVPKVGAWNTPPRAFNALTGWAQAFWTGDVDATKTALQVRSIRTYLCSETPSGINWSRVQSGRVEGADFNADFLGNIAVPAMTTPIDSEAIVVRWRSEGVFHFWPSGPRAMLNDARICGIVVLVEARAEYPNGFDMRRGGILLGLGADYWEGLSSLWNNHSTNTAVAIGRMRIVTPEWRQYGISTANDHNIRNLLSSGLLDRP